MNKAQKHTLNPGNHARKRNSSRKKPSLAKMEILVYDEQSSHMEQTQDIRKLIKLIDKSKVNLLIVNDISDANLIDELSKLFSIHPMVMEDLLSESELPKVQESGDQLLLTLKLLDFTDSGRLELKHLGMILGEYYVIVFKDSDNKVFDDIKARIDNGKSKARQKKADYLFYLLTDTIVDTYYSVVDEIDNKIDKIEVILLEQPETNYINHLYLIKQPLSDMRGILYSIREALLNIVQGDYALIDDETIPYLHDVKDHINNIVHMYELSRDTISDLLEINNSNINNRLNGTMKIMTIITTFFIPLTLITGIYGMNFKYMPEISWKLGYPLVVLIMIIVSGIMFYIMKKDKIL
jgi:magnesium transporter